MSGPWDSGGGGGITQAAADLRYAEIAKSVTGGDAHDHAGGDGGPIAGIAPTGAVQDYIGTAPPTGWLLWTNSSGYLQIGDASSGANLRANADCEALYILIYNAMANGQAPVNGGRGANAAADWAAHKYITLPDIRGRAVIGTGTGSGLTARTHGAVVGSETNTLSIDTMPSHPHTIPLLNQNVVLSGSGTVFARGGSTEDSGSKGGGSAHANVQPSLPLHKIIKL